MSEKTAAAQKISLKSTKQEMLAAYHDLLKQLEEQEKIALKPEVTMERKKSKEVVDIADGLSTESVMQGVNSVRAEIGKLLVQLTESLEKEVQKYKTVREAIEVREKDLRDIYEIEKSAQTLAALIEAQSAKREEFEREMAEEKEKLSNEIADLRTAYQQEKVVFEAQRKEQDEAEQKRREREKEEYEYSFKRQQQLAHHAVEDELKTKEKEMQQKKETVDKEIAERARKIAEDEKRVAELQKRFINFPQEMETTVQKAVKESTEKLQTEAKTREELLRKTFEGEKNVFVAQIDSLEKTTKEQKEQILRLSQQLEKAYQKIEDIAVKTVGGITEAKALLANTSRTEEQTKRQ